jgi:hypothetical protein
VPPAASAFGDSDCGGCVQQTCSSEFLACDADVSCGSYLACLLDCPVIDGDVDPACEASCSVPASGAAAQAFTAFDDCRHSRGAAACPACGNEGAPGAGGAGSGAPLCGIPALEQSCGVTTALDPCIRCISEECCDSVDDVLDGGPATDLSDCWLSCDTPECEDACYAAYPDGVAGFGLYDACTAVNCFTKDVCPVQACTKCSATQCTCEYATCLADVSCHLIRQCVGTCATPSCAEACVAEHPDGAETFELLLVCTSQHCIEEC